MKNTIYPRAVLRARNILCLYALAYCVKVLRDSDRCNWGDQQLLKQLEPPRRKTFTSVLPEVATPPILLLDENGLLVQDTEIKYSIKPSDYTASIALLMIYENEEQFLFSFATVTGEGSLTLSKGSKLDSTKNYTVELVLNYGGDAEMRSEKKEIPVLSITVNDDTNALAQEIKFGR